MVSDGIVYPSDTDQDLLPICFLCDEELKPNDLHMYYEDEFVHTDCVTTKIDRLIDKEKENEQKCVF